MTRSARALRRALLRTFAITALCALAPGLAHAATISGTVTKTSGQGAEGACVIAQSASFYQGTTTSPTGEYTIPGLIAGTYRVVFDDCDGPLTGFEYVRTWWHDKPDEPSADPITLGAADTRSGVDQTVQIAGSISGTVRDHNGAPLGIFRGCVSAFPGDAHTDPDAFRGSPHSSVTGPDGRYVVHDLPPGLWKLMFRDCGHGSYGYYYGVRFELATRFSGDSASLDSAQAIPLSEGEHATAPDAQLPLGGFLTGRVTDTSSRPLAGVCVGVFDSGGELVNGERTDLNGDYGIGYSGGRDLGPLTPDSYRVRFTTRTSECSFASGDDYVTQYFSGKRSFGAADPVGVTALQETAHIDARMARPVVGSPGPPESPGRPAEPGPPDFVNLPNRFRRRVQVGLGGRFALPGAAVVCSPASACRVRGLVRRRASSGRKRVVLGRTAFQVAGGDQAPIRLRLWREGLATLRKARRLKVRVSLKAESVAGRTNARTALILRSPRPRR